MRKTDKKTDNALREALTEVCEIALEKFEGFKWLTHFANYDSFPSSLSIVCVFSTSAELSDFLNDQQDREFRELIHQYLLGIGIKLKNIAQHVSFETEDAFSKR